MVSDQLLSLIVLLLLVIDFVVVVFCVGYLLRNYLNSNGDVFLRLLQATLGLDNSLRHHVTHH